MLILQPVIECALLSHGVAVFACTQGNKKIMAKQGEPLGKVISRGGLRIKFDCKNGRCATCQVRLNGRAAAKVCQGATIPGGATKKLSIVSGRSEYLAWLTTLRGTWCTHGVHQ